MSIMEKFKLDGKVALVTGCSKGIGFGIAKGLAEAGADIIVPHMGLTTGGSIGAETGYKLDQCPQLIDDWAREAMKINKEIIQPKKMIIKE